MQTITENETPFACDMSALNAEQRKRVLDLLAELKAKRQEIAMGGDITYISG